MVIIDDDNGDDEIGDVMTTMMSDGYDEDLILMFFIYDSKVSLDPIGDGEGA